MARKLTHAEWVRVMAQARCGCPGELQELDLWSLITPAERPKMVRLLALETELMDLLGAKFAEYDALRTEFEGLTQSAAYVVGRGSGQKVLNYETNKANGAFDGGRVTA